MPEFQQICELFTRRFRIDISFVIISNKEGSEVSMDFLYFPEDKTEYISAFISLVIIMVLAIIATVIIQKKSKRDEKKFDDEFKHVIDNEVEDSISSHNNEGK